MVSAMGALLPDVMGTKVYSTLNGQFNFVVNLFSRNSGIPLAVVMANELTRLRTAATTAVAADLLARADAKVLSLFGAGTQAQAHAQALMLVRNFDQILICARTGAAEFAAQLSNQFGVDARAVGADEAASADVIATCTRAAEPVFDGANVQPGAFVAAVGSSKPVARELDDTLLARAACIAVEWLPAASSEAGEFVRAAPGLIQTERVMELGKLLVNQKSRDPRDIIVYKSVGIGLEDVALANWVYQRLKGGTSV
jgi:ornithine cyclodeaminase